MQTETSSPLALHTVSLLNLSLPLTCFNLKYPPVNEPSPRHQQFSFLSMLNATTSILLYTYICPLYTLLSIYGDLHTRRKDEYRTKNKQTKQNKTKHRSSVRPPSPVRPLSHSLFHFLPTYSMFFFR